MESVRACTSCAAVAQARQRWCLECGAELPPARRGALRPVVGIATTLALLVGAASAGGYTLLHDEAQPPPPATTVAATPANPATAPPATTTPPATPYTPYTPPTSTTPLAPAPSPVPLPRRSTRGGSRASGGATTTTGRSRPGTATPVAPTPAPKPKPVYALTDVALGAAAVAYAPYAPANADLGDATRVVDGTTRTGWRTPSFSDPNARPQVGVYVDLASAQKLRKLVLQTSTPGIDIEVYGATKGPPDTITTPGWDHLATRNDIAGKTTIGLPSGRYRYVLVWIVGLPSGRSSAAISELSLLSLQPE
jgi:hypothetical protein